MSEEIKDAAFAALQGLLDDCVLRIRRKFVEEGFRTSIMRVDYVAQVAVLEFVDENAQPEAEKCDAIGRAMRQEWPEMPDAKVALFKLANKPSKLIIDIGTTGHDRPIQEHPHYEAAKEAVKGMTAAQKKFPVISYELTRRDG